MDPFIPTAPGAPRQPVAGSMPSAPTDSTTPARPLSAQEYVAQMRARRETGRPTVVESTPPQPEPHVFAPLSTPTPEPQPAIVEPPAPSAPVQPEEPATTAIPTGSAYDDSYLKPQPEETLISWEAPSRPFKQRDRQYYATIAAIVVLISLILLFIGQWLPIAVVISVGFLAYVMSSVPPHTATYKLTTYGVRIDNELFYWDELGRFWVETKYRLPVMYIEIFRFPNRITLMLGDIPEPAMTTMFAEVLLNEKPAPTYLDKAAEWMQKKLPLEKE